MPQDGADAPAGLRVEPAGGVWAAHASVAPSGTPCGARSRPRGPRACARRQGRTRGAPVRRGRAWGTEGGAELRGDAREDVRREREGEALSLYCVFVYNHSQRVPDVRREREGKQEGGGGKRGGGGGGRREARREAGREARRQKRPRRGCARGNQGAGGRETKHAGTTRHGT